MAENTDPHPDDAMDQPVDGVDMPIEEESIEAVEAHPRREASAEFIVQTEATSVTVLREAMDPANQSLGDALRLSYRMLQLVMVVLVILFLVSGFRRIKVNETGVKTLFGRIQTKDNQAELSPGLAVSFWPYPAAEFIVFDQTGAVTIADTYWPDKRIGTSGSYEKAAPSVLPHDDVRLGLGADRDGFILLDHGDLGHMQLQATYAIMSPEQFVRTVSGPDDATRIVRLALEHGTVHVVAAHDLDAMVNQEEVMAEQIRHAAQAFLDDLDCGIKLTAVQATSIRPPMAVYTALNLLGQARNQADQTVAEARTEMNTTLVAAAGQNWRELLTLIEQYEQTVLSAGDDGVNAPEARSILESIDDMLLSDQVGGGVATQMQAAKAYREEIKADLGAFAQRFNSLLPRYRENPELVVQNEWIKTYSTILARRDAEIFRMASWNPTVKIIVVSTTEAMLRQRKARQERQSEEAMQAAGITGPYRRRFSDEDQKQRLQRDEAGGVRGRGQ